MISSIHHETFWSIIVIVAFETLNSARRNEFILINVMHKLNCGVYLWKTICENDFFENYIFHLISAKWRWKKHFWFSIDLLFITVFENEISAKFIFSNEKTSNVKNFCVKMNCFEFNIQTIVQKHCWIEFVFRIIFFKSWKWKKQFCNSIFVADHLKTKSKI